MQKVYEIKKEVKDLKILKMKIENEINEWGNKYLSETDIDKKNRYKSWIVDNQKQLDAIDFKLSKLNKWLNYCG